MPPLVIAHRGDSHDRPENTLAAFSAALEAGVSAVELDVQLTADGQVVVIHDPTVDRTTAGHGPVGEMTLAQLRSLSAGYPSRFGNAYAGERVPALVEVLGFLRDRARVLIEIKPDSVTEDAQDGIEVRTIAEVVRARMEHEVALISFSRTALLRCREHAPAIVRGHLFHEGGAEQILAGARAVGSDLVLPEKSLLSDALREQAREGGIKVATWVVDDPHEMQRLLRFDLYGIASNRPGAMLEALSAATER